MNKILEIPVSALAVTVFFFLNSALCPYLPPAKLEPLVDRAFESAFRIFPTIDHESAIKNCLVGFWPRWRCR